jgi:hypothetical protein
VLGDIEEMVRHIPASVGKCEEWPAIVNAAKPNETSYCKGRHGKPPFRVLYGAYTVTLLELKAVLKARTLAGHSNVPKTTGQQTKRGEGFQEVRRRKRRATEEITGTSKKAAVQTKTSPALYSHPKEVVIRNFFAPLRTADMETDASGIEAISNAESVPGKTSRPPQIILTFTTNLIQLQKQLKIVAKGKFDFRSTRNGTRVITRGMADLQSVQTHFDDNYLSYYSFYPKSEKFIRVVMSHTPHINPAAVISEGLVSFEFDVISVKQMTATHRSPSD